MSVADSLRALQERHQKEDEKRHRERELEDLRLRLARAEEHFRVLEAALQAREEREEPVKLEKHDDDVDYDPDEEVVRKERVEKYLRENQNTWKYSECDEDERTLLGAVPTYNGTGDVPALNGFVNKLEMAANRAGFNDEETLDLGVTRLMGQAAVIWQSHCRANPQGSPSRWRRWEDLKGALVAAYYPREHLQAATVKLMEVTQQSCGNNLKKHIETLNALYMELPVP
ncbi:MAG: hypothetical protein BJ554DRAFT_4439 [Olpidium bornovanus]|uniref:Uncharacterized protein n=1 Tax=Olpidium bornovanus TaxID=278681 RepID=A0A8H8DLD8_9FUNG|nr:MAG: hypothetical protein BJ554DRAFT_4439 [Olpidium bornovanus]